jgi:RNA polymerase sigma factor (sigma-70 family)
MTDHRSAELWAAFRGGNLEALAVLFEAHYAALFSYGLKLTGDEEMVKDGIQQLFQKLLQRPGQVAAVQLVKAYFFTALRRHLGDETKRRRRSFSLLNAYADPFEVTYSHEEFLIAQQSDAAQQARLMGALNRLSQRQREALYLKFFDGFSYEHIAEVMALNTQSVRNLVFNALKALRSSMLISLALVGLLVS